MSKRVPASMRTRESLSALIEGRLSSPDGRSELVKLATRLILEEALRTLLLLDIEGKWRPVWVAWAERVTVRRLEQDVGRALLLRARADFAAGNQERAGIQAGKARSDEE